MAIETLHESAAWKAQPVSVSALLITYNQYAYVADALRSVLAQTYPLDLVISDDGSKDATVREIRKVLQSYSGPHRIRLRSKLPNLGVVGNQNAGLALLEGDFVVLFEGDDVSLPTRVKSLVELYMHHDRRLAAIGSSITTMDAAGNDIEQLSWPEQQANARDVIRQKWSVHGCSLAFRRKVFTDFGTISTHLFSGDGPLWMRAAFSRPGGVAQVQRPLVRYRLHDQNVSTNIKVDFSSEEALIESCRYLLNNEIAQRLEVRKIERYLLKRGVRNDPELAELKRVTYRRAVLVYTFAKLPKGRWVWAVLLAMCEPQLRRLALRFMKAAL
ncbi:MAG TPA: glycosyltransferase [Longimicrobiales bacterium]|nr:glycosyltransferase [Longimicrobiales bacterium]